MRVHPSLLGFALLLAACGQEPSVASKSAAAYRENPVTASAGGHSHHDSGEAPQPSAATVDHSQHGAHAAAPAAVAEDHSAHAGHAGAAAAVAEDHSAHAGHGRAAAAVAEDHGAHVG
ncbi:MAG TPA: hypothetical protein VF698_00390, partial [Thermoanaerobaculia bacterium]